MRSIERNLKEKLTSAPVLNPNYPNFTTIRDNYRCIRLRYWSGTVAKAGRLRPIYRLRKQDIK